MQPSARHPVANHDSACAAGTNTSTAAHAPDTTSAPTPAAPSTTNATLLREAERRPDDVQVTEEAPGDGAEEKEEQDDGALSLEEVCRQTHERIERFLARDSTHDALLGQVQAQTRTGLGVVAEALRRYSLDEISLSYNGGKDCLVLLVLFLAGLHAHYHPATSTSNPTTPSHHLPPFPTTLRSIYILSSHPFPEVEAFVRRSSRAYRLSLARSAAPMKAAFAAYLAQHPGVRAIFVGTRRTDPHGAELTHFDPTDRGWPAFVRVHPVIDWHYREIWAFIRCLEVEYCELYDMGYTSLGGTTDTNPNPALVLVDGKGVRRYRPAYELMEDDEERLGRE